MLFEDTYTTSSNANNTEQLSKQEDEDIIISVRNVGKMYMLFNQPIDRLKHSLFNRFGKSYGREFWALHDISFDVRQGEAVGILGRNGSGKSTLLNIIAGVLQPTLGEIHVTGRISALLELGSGFNSEYTGRENVFLSGAILGLSHDEMEARYDDIVAFADIGEYIDQPVKTYSSGMFARLAFSVAIAVEPDILIVDEILAVGDYNFQQKCVARMRQMRDNGLTLLFVSHSPDVIKDTCNKGLFLREGQSIYIGSAEQAASLYFQYVRELANKDALQAQPELHKMVPFETKIKHDLRYGTGHAQVEKVEVCNEAGESYHTFNIGDYIKIFVFFRIYVDMQNFSVSFVIRDNMGIDITGTTTFDERFNFPELKAGDRGWVCFRFQNNLRLGNYGVNVALNRVSQRDYSDNVVLDAIEATATFLSLRNPERPVHYKCFYPVTINYQI